MAEKKRADQLGVGEEFEPYEFHVTPEFNRVYIEAVEDYHPRYLQATDLGPPVVHPALLVVQSNVTRSPSFHLPPGMAAVHSKEKVEYLNWGRVGKTFKVYWKVIETYEKRGRPYQVKDALIVDEDGMEILRRKIIDTYIAGEE